ncbi:MAG: hypothetical protein PUF72_08005 [Clostridiales bacterium]|nr:hypothetical protein [Clostridiales bacterium]
MKNDVFSITLDPFSGAVNSIVLNADKDGMNWVDRENGGKLWGLVKNLHLDNIWGDYKSRAREMSLVSFEEKDNHAVSCYSNGRISAYVERFFKEDGNFCERYTLKNISDSDVFLEQADCGITVPFTDRYTDAQDCMTNRCNTHIWCGHNTAYINALKMGISDHNIGLVLTRGAIDSYSILNIGENLGSSYRGEFIMNTAHTELLPGEECVIEWELFPCRGVEDFYEKISRYPSYIGITAKHFTVFKGEKIELEASSESAKAYLDGEELPVSVSNGKTRVEYEPKRTGAHRIWVESGGAKTFADFHVSLPMEELVKNRLDFIVKKQQYKREGSHLDGAFLIYDNAEEHFVFDDTIGDHNACRERIGMALLLIKYLQTHENEEYREALDRYITFLYREFFDASRGQVYDTVGKNEAHMRLYNAPWVSMLLTEMYRLTDDTKYLYEILKLLEFYYSNGGTKFYPNGFSVFETYSAFESAGLKKEAERVKKLFTAHADNMVSNGTAYPKHEVNYEQTIVSPAATITAEWARVTEEEKYRKDAKLHIEILERFNGHQPSFHLNEIPIRYWDDYWFGKSMLTGDTFPHYWSCLTARSYKDYYNISGDEKYLNAAEECMRNCLCLFDDEGKGSCAYVYPYRINGEKGEFYDEWANDQDFALYFALETGLCNIGK